MVYLQESSVILLALFQSFSFLLFYLGTCRIPKSLHNIFYITLLNFILGSVLWFAVGYSMVFGPSQKGFIGAMDYALLIDVPEVITFGISNNETKLDTSHYDSFSMVIFEMTFAILAPAIVLITWSDQIKLTAAMLFITLWPLFVYYPLAHWIRSDNGWLSIVVKVIDLAGGLTLHTTVGTAHFLLTILIKRKFSNSEKLSLFDQYLQKKTETRNSILLFLGSLLTIAGWFSMNVGSPRSTDNLNGLVLINTHFTACSSAVLWVITVQVYTGQSSCMDILYGLMSGLAASSSYCGTVQPWSSILIGCFIGILSNGIFIITTNHMTLCIRENCLDITFIFGIPAILGSIAAGLFSNKETSNEVAEMKGAFYSNPFQLSYQFLGIIVVILWTSFWTLLIYKFIHSTVGLFTSQYTSNNEETLNNNFNVCEIHKRNNEENLVKEKLIKAAKDGDLQQLKDLRKKFVVNFALKDFYQRTALHYTSKNGDYVSTQYLLKQREVDVHAKDMYEATPLSEAVRKHREDIIVLLLEHGASWSADNVGNILCSYVAMGKIDEVRRLHNLGMDLNSTDLYGRTSLHIAAGKGDPLMVECLLSMHVQINKVDYFGQRPLNCAEMHEHEAISEILIKYGALRVIHNYSQREICDEASKGNLRMIKHMVNHGANISYQDTNGKTALHASCESGQLDVVKFLLNQPGVNVNVKDKKNNTPLTEAIVNMHNDIAEYVQLHGGHTEERRMMHLICKAVKNHDKRLVKQLLQWFNGSIVTDLDGQSVYHIAVRNGDINMLQTLVKAGINSRQVDFFGNTPLELAIQLRCNSSIIKLLSEVEEGKLKAQNSQVNLEVSRLDRPSKSKIRRRRTRRQTRVEVASGDFSDRSIPGSQKFDDSANYDRNAFEVEQEVVLQDESLGTTTPDEVTLADIELMNRQKKINSSKLSELMQGEPQYV